MTDAMGITRSIARSVATFRSEQVPPEVFAAAKGQMLDTLACAWAGSDSGGIAGVRDLLVERGGRSEATTWVYADRLPVTAAARLNGMMSAALDYDCLHDRATAHPGIVVLPAALAVGERLGSSGRDVLTALVLGNEIIIRLCGAVKTRPGWFYTSALGVFASAATAAYLMRLDENATTNALGIALCYAAGTGQALIEKTLTKRLQSAVAAEAGVEAALMAQRGITGPAQALEGVAGFFNLYTPGDEEAAVADLGEKFRLPELTYKKYPSCFFNHAPLEAALDLIAEHDLRPEDIAEVQVRVAPHAAKFVGADFFPGDAPQVTAQFSLKYSIASALLHRRLGLAEIEPDAVRDPRIPAIAQKVTVIGDSERSGFVPIDVCFRTTTGAEYSMRMEAVPGTPEKPLSARELRAKVMECFGRGALPLTPHQSDEFIARIMSVENADRIGALFSGLPALPLTRAA